MSIPFAPPDITDKVINEVVDCLKSGWITTGPVSSRLEERIAQISGLSNAYVCNSATSALTMALKWFGIGKGDEVIIPAYTYAATGLAVLHVGATPVMVDVGYDYNLNPEELSQKITSRTKAVIPVDFAGWPCDYRAINHVVSDRSALFNPESGTQEQLQRVLILADAAHSLGASYANQPAAKSSDIAVYSLHAVKNITSAEGGAVVFNLPKPFINEDVKKFFKLWGMNGQTKDAFTKTQGGGWEYDIVVPGYKMNLPDVLAAIALAQLEDYETRALTHRRRLHTHYHNALSELRFFDTDTYAIDQEISSCHFYPARITDEHKKNRDIVIDNMKREGIHLNVHFKPLPRLSIFRNLGFNIKDYPISDRLYQQEISLPIYSTLSLKNAAIITKKLSFRF